MFGYVQKLGDWGAAARARVRAERRCGELLKDMDKAKGGWPSDKTNSPGELVSTLKDMALNKNQGQQDAGMIISMVQACLF